MAAFIAFIPFIYYFKELTEEREGGRERHTQEVRWKGEREEGKIQ